VPVEVRRDSIAGLYRGRQRLQHLLPEEVRAIAGPALREANWREAERPNTPSWRRTIRPTKRQAARIRRHKKQADPVLLVVSGQVGVPLTPLPSGSRRSPSFAEQLTGVPVNSLAISWGRLPVKLRSSDEANRVVRRHASQPLSLYGSKGLT
jgi:hypothetical protein